MTEIPSAGGGVHEYLAVQADALIALREPVMAREPDAVHRMRVATRRLRSVLSTYGSLYAAVPFKRRRLRWLADELGKVRDLEVLRTRFAKRLGDERPDWFTALEAAEQAAYGPLAEACARERTVKLLAAVGTLAAYPDFAPAAARPAGEVLGPVVEAARADMLRAVAAVAGAADADEARHRARNAAKRTRYTADAAAGALGEEAAAVAAEAKRLQNRFGRCQDDIVAIRYLEAHAPDSPLLEDERRRHAKHVARVEELLSAV
ncbi:CHAD domain-containing protein [Glycomyces terrestris]|uniref:CHAD domain-containing protein n=1 Tax=Glycomyces terrestris TaxID=2493553 RepID=A0A426V018_9ACTN|nr:CHAD domain-containing protein [Glycomyces terrestris]RRS00200.1 CHAD domain-containing protein [Glycomyces terrestris]